MAERLTEHEAHEGIYEKYPDYISATEKLAYYEDLEEQGKLIELPCKIGDTVYGTRRWHGTKIAKAGTVSEMFYTQEGKLMIVVKYVCRGYWGEKIFATLEEAEAALKGAEHDT